jgi:hypothetical protein
LALDLFLNTYRVAAIAREVLDENHRTIEEQMASLRLFDLGRNCPTHAAMLLFAKDPLRWLPYAYVQFVDFPGTTMAGSPTEKRFTGDLLTLLRGLDAFVRTLPKAHPVDVPALREEDELSSQWSDCLDGKAKAFRITTAFHRVVQLAANEFKADLVLLDVGPNLGALNRCALIAADHVAVPLVPDLYSLQGLRNL